MYGNYKGPFRRSGQVVLVSYRGLVGLVGYQPGGRAGALASIITADLTRPKVRLANGADGRAVSWPILSEASMSAVDQRCCPVVD